MTTEHEASRTLVKSPPELWAECSDAASLARHLDQFGDIRITKLEPETAVAWEGEEISGTVRLEPSGWGTRVTMTARSEPQEPPESEPVAPEPEPEPVAPEPEPATPEPEPDPLPPAAAHPPRGLWARLRTWLSAAPADAEPEPDVAPTEAVSAPPPKPEPVPEPVAEAPEPDLPATEVALSAALESLGQAHHRPYSRA